MRNPNSIMVTQYHAAYNPKIKPARKHVIFNQIKSLTEDSLTHSSLPQYDNYARDLMSFQKELQEETSKAYFCASHMGTLSIKIHQYKETTNWTT